MFDELLAAMGVAPIEWTKIDEAWLQQQAAAGVDTLDELVETVGALAKRKAMLSINGMRPAALAQLIAKQLGVTVPQATTIADTAMVVFYRALAGRGYDKIEATGSALRFGYYGPQDKLTRPFCERVGKMTAAGSLTREQIAALDNGQGTDVFTHGGGFNCRHQWIVVEDAALAESKLKRAAQDQAEKAAKRAAKEAEREAKRIERERKAQEEKERKAREAAERRARRQAEREAARRERMAKGDARSTERVIQDLEKIDKRFRARRDALVDEIQNAYRVERLAKLDTPAQRQAERDFAKRTAKLRKISVARVAAMREALYSDREAEIVVLDSYGLSDRQKAALSFVRRAAGNVLSDGTRVLIEPTAAGPSGYQDRSHFHLGTVRLTPGEDPDVLVHEFGHVIEYWNAGVLRDSQSFLVRRTTDANGVREPLVALNSLGNSSAYNPGEMTRQDEFWTPYIGKEYFDATEILSMGLQQLYNDPLWLARKDRDFFDYLWRTLR